jgi:carbon storage regulator
MLVLTRKVGESIRIGDDIEVLVTAVDKGKVKIGIRSPRHIPVYREELYQKITNDNRDAALMKTGDVEAMLEQLPVKK